MSADGDRLCGAEQLARLLRHDEELLSLGDAQGLGGGVARICILSGRLKRARENEQALGVFVRRIRLPVHGMCDGLARPVLGDGGVAAGIVAIAGGGSSAKAGGSAVVRAQPMYASGALEHGLTQVKPAQAASDRSRTSVTTLQASGHRP